MCPRKDKNKEDKPEKKKAGSAHWQKKKLGAKRMKGS